MPETSSMFKVETTISFTDMVEEEKKDVDDGAMIQRIRTIPMNEDDLSLGIPEGSDSVVSLSWVCRKCSYSNVDVANEKCAVCGTKDRQQLLKQRNWSFRKRRNYSWFSLESSFTASSSTDNTPVQEEEHGDLQTRVIQEDVVVEEKPKQEPEPHLPEASRQETSTILKLESSRRETSNEFPPESSRQETTIKPLPESSPCQEPVSVSLPETACQEKSPESVQTDTNTNTCADPMVVADGANSPIRRADDGEDPPPPSRPPSRPPPEHPSIDNTTAKASEPSLTGMSLNSMVLNNMKNNRAKTSQEPSNEHRLMPNPKNTRIINSKGVDALKGEDSQVTVRTSNRSISRPPVNQEPTKDESGKRRKSKSQVDPSRQRQQIQETVLRQYYSESAKSVKRELSQLTVRKDSEQQPLTASSRPPAHGLSVLATPPRSANRNANHESTEAASWSPVLLSSSSEPQLRNPIRQASLPNYTSMGTQNTSSQNSIQVHHSLMTTRGAVSDRPISAKYVAEARDMEEGRLPPPFFVHEVDNDVHDTSSEVIIAQRPRASWFYCFIVATGLVLVAFLVLLTLVLKATKNNNSNTSVDSNLVSNPATPSWATDAPITTTAPILQPAEEDVVNLEMLGSGEFYNMGASVSVGGPEGRWVAIVWKNFVCVKELVKHDTINELQNVGKDIKIPNGQSVSQVSLSADSLAVAHEDGSIFLYQLNKNLTEWEGTQISGDGESSLLNNESSVATSVSISQTGAVVVASGVILNSTKGSRAQVQVFDDKYGDEILNDMPKLNFTVDSSIHVELSYDGRVLVVLTDGYVCTFLRSQDGSKWKANDYIKPTGDADVVAIALSGDGAKLALTSRNETRIYHNFTTNRQILNTIGVGGFAVSLSYSGEFCAIGRPADDERGTVELWKFQNGSSSYQEVDKAPIDMQSEFVMSISKSRWGEVLGVVAPYGQQNGSLHMYQISSNIGL